MPCWCANPDCTYQIRYETSEGFTLKTPAFLFHPFITLAALVAIVTTASVQIAAILAQQQVFVTALGPQEAAVVISFLQRASADLTIATTILSIITAMGRSIVPAVDAGVTPASPTSVTPPAP